MVGHPCVAGCGHFCWAAVGQCQDMAFGRLLKASTAKERTIIQPNSKATVLVLQNDQLTGLRNVTTLAINESWFGCWKSHVTLRQQK